MKWRIVFARSAEKDLRNLSSEAQRRIGRAIRNLEADAFPPGTKRLKGREEFRLRVGDYRVLYIIAEGADTLTIVAIGHRRDCLPMSEAIISVENLGGAFASNKAGGLENEM
jgi:mRNA interferase RelE/StbE